jgi:hypothetical protein
MSNNPYARPFVIRPVCDLPLPGGKDLRCTHRTAYASYCYIRRTPDADVHGPMPTEWATRDDLVATGREFPASAPAWARTGPQIWLEADASVTPERAGEPSAFHIVMALPEMGVDGWRYLIECFCDRVITSKGMIADWAIHAKKSEDGEWAIRPHVHLLVSARTYRKDRRPGRRHPRWFGSTNDHLAAQRAWEDIAGLKPVVTWSPADAHRPLARAA